MLVGREDGWGFTRCTAGIARFHIFTNGDVTPCAYLPAKAGILLTDGVDTCGTEGVARTYAKNFGDNCWFLYTI